MTKSAIIESFLENLLYHKKYSTKTISSYKCDLYQYSQTITTNIENSSTHDVQGWIRRLHTSGQSSKTIQRKLSSVRSFFNFLIDAETIKNNPAQTIKAPKDSKKLPKALSINELSYLLEIQPTTDIEIRDLACFDLLYSCGIRLSELSTIKIRDINLSEKSVKITGKGNKQRISYFGNKTVKSIENWLNVRANFSPKTNSLFVNKDGGALSNRSIQKRLEMFAIKHATKHIHPHMLRHSFASHVLDSSKDLLAVKDLLGHADISSTQIYTHLNFQQLAEVFDKAHPRAKKK